MFSSRLCELIVEGSSQGRSFRRIEDLHARRGEREDLPRDAGVIHVAQSPLAEILNALGQRRGTRAGARIESPQAAKSGIVITIFEQLAIAGDQFGRRES